MNTPEQPTAATMYCLGCRYCLDGLTESRCPECGRAFDPRDSSTVANDSTLVRTRRLEKRLLICAFAATALFLLPILVPGPLTAVALVLDLSVLVIAIPTAVALRSRLSWRLSLAIALAVIPVGYVGLLLLMGLILMQLK